MVVRSPVRSPVRNVVQSVFGAAEAFNPFQLFTSGAQGAWYDPSDFSTLYQNAAGTTPVTAVEQPVRLMLDRSRGLVLGSELVTNGDFSNGTTGWSTFFSAGTGSLVVAGGVATLTAGTNYASAGQSITTVVGRWYQVSGTIISAPNSGFNAFRKADELNAATNIVDIIASGPAISTPITQTAYFLATATTSWILFQVNAASGTISFDNISVRELPGNHAVAPNDASRPVLRSRYNLLTRSEEFDHGDWAKSGATVTANAAVAPDGTTTADKLIETATTNLHYAANTNNRTGTFTYSVFAKAAERTSVAIAKASNSDQVRFNLSAGVITSTGADWSNASIEALADGWYRCAATITLSSDWIYISPNTALSYTGDGTSGVLIWGAQLLTAADHAATGGAYQRVGAATDYDTGPPWRPYLAFDGSDDSMSTSSIDFSGTDKVAVFAGVTRASSTSTGILTELSTSVTTVNGSFAIVDRGLLDATTNGDYGVRSRGTTTVSVAGTTLTVPTTSVLTMLSDISAPSLSLAVNGAPYVSSTSTQGTGNFANAALFIGRRNNTSNPFNGRLTSLIVLGRTATAAEISATEQWIAGKTGVTI